METAVQLHQPLLSGGMLVSFMWHLGLVSIKSLRQCERCCFKPQLVVKGKPSCLLLGETRKAKWKAPALFSVQQRGQ